MASGKYRKRPDISILVAEKNLNPLGNEQAEHDVSDVAWFLKGYGFSVDAVWTLSKWRFKDFGKFCSGIMAQLDERLLKAAGRKDELVRRMGEKYAREAIEEFRALKEILRNAPIRSVEELARYDILVLHPDFDDSYDIVPQIVERYPAKPIIIPRGSVAAGSPDAYEFSIEDVRKDTKYNAYYIGACSVCDSVLEIIEYVLDRNSTSENP